MENEKPEEERMPLTSHLEELKTRLIRILIAVGVGFGVCYMFKDWSFRVITKPLVDAMPAQSSMIFTGLPEAFFIHMKIAFFASLFLTAPYTLFEIWRFVSRTVQNERRLVFPFHLLLHNSFPRAFCSTFHCAAAGVQLLREFFHGFPQADDLVQGIPRPDAQVPARLRPQL
jgi:hypothetical protein